MKNALIFIAGLIVGVVCLYAWQGYQFGRMMMDAPISQFSANDASSRQSFEITYDKPVRIAVIDSEDAFSLTLTRLPNGNVGYAWLSDTNKASSGSGELFEKYEEVAKTPTGSHVKDVGSSLGIEIQDVTLEWSSGSDSSGWIYYNPSKITLAYQTKKD